MSVLQQGEPENEYRQAWLEVAKREQILHTGLNEELVVHLVDSQMNSFAKNTFSESVETAVVNIGFHHEAQRWKLIRKWYRAEDEGENHVAEIIKLFWR